MQTNTIKWRIFKYNLIIIMLMISFVAIIFNIAIRTYIKNDVLAQLERIASRAADTAIRKGPDLFPEPHKMPPPDALQKILPEKEENDLLRFYFMLDRSLREPLSVLSADFILLDQDKKKIDPPKTPEGLFQTSEELQTQIIEKVIKLENIADERYINFHMSGTEYVAIIKPVSDKNTFGLGWIIVFSNVQKVNQLQLGINIILLVVLVFSAFIIVVVSSIVSKKISAPFSTLNEHIRAIAERNFGTKIQMPVYDELREFVNNINIMSEKLESYDKAQKTFLQNASHEFRTPLMSIQSYAEGIKYDVVDKDTAVDVITDETKRMTHMVEDLLYLSRLDTIEENYRFCNINFNEFIESCIGRMNAIAIKANVKINYNFLEEKLDIYGDEEKLARAFTNIISNCIRYAGSMIEINMCKLDTDRIQITIGDDGPGFDENEIPSIFERFYKGKKGNYGLGLAITKSVIEKHNGKVHAKNTDAGALFIIELPLI